MAATTGCGGGGGSAPPPPAARLIAASWSGSGTAPAAGDTLVLTFDQAVALLAGTVFDDDDLLLQGSDTLGNVTAAPTARTANSIEVVLGNGVSLRSTVSELDLSPDQDTVTGLAGLPAATRGETVTLRQSDGQAPRVAQFTIERIQDELNGEGAAGGTLQVPQNGFAFFAVLDDGAQFAGPSAVALSLDRPVTSSSGTIPAGADLGTRLSSQTVSLTGLELRVGPDLRLPPGPATATVTLVDASGLPSETARFAFRVVVADAALRPLENGQTWFLDLSRDLEAIEAVTRNGGIRSTEVTPGANGRSDFDDVRRALGLWTANGIADVGDGRSSNDVVRDRFQAAILRRLEDLFDGVAIEFTFSAPGSFPSGEPAVPYASFGFSQICIAGAAAESPSGTLGAALLDARNDSQENDCLDNFQGLRLGVFLETAVRIGLESGASSTFQTVFVPFAPILGGQPIGEDPMDGARLLGNGPGPRSDQIDRAVDALAALTALVTAHECGHSMGFVANGAMPVGLYGGDAANFPLSGSQPASNADHHIENQSLFPGGATNVMSPSLDLDAALSTATGFNRLNLAYLRERAHYDDR